MLCAGAVLLLSVGTVAAANKPASTKSNTSNAASGSTTATTGGVQSFGAAAPIQNGTIVQLAGQNASQVAAASYDKLEQMYGVAVDPQSLSLTVSSGNVTNETYVATAGTYPVLVSTQNGPIKENDYITISAIDGVGMKASTDEKVVLGRAGTNFNGKSNGIGNVSLKDTKGQSAKTVTLGIIPVVVDIKHNPNQKSTKAAVPNWLQRIGTAVAEKPVSAIRIYISIFITGVSVVAAITILYGGVRNSIISIGRNPLSKKSIFRGLLEIVLTSIIVLIVGLFTVYLLLKL
jgi:hypothetical protein